MSERRPYRYWEDPAWVADSDPKVVAKLIRDQRDLLDECERVIEQMCQIADALPMITKSHANTLQKR